MDAEGGTQIPTFARAPSSAPGSGAPPYLGADGFFNAPAGAAVHRHGSAPAADRFGSWGAGAFSAGATGGAPGGASGMMASGDDSPRHSVGSWGSGVPGVDYEDFSRDAPLLEELGVNFGHIRSKVAAVLLLHKPVSPTLMAEADMAGPLTFCLLLGFCLLLSGKLHGFSYIYGFALCGCCAMYALVSLLAHDEATGAGAGGAGASGHGLEAAGGGTGGAAGAPLPFGGVMEGGGAGGDATASGSGSAQLDLARTFSVLGYCLLPIVALSALAVFVSLQGPLGAALGMGAVVWCTLSASRLFEVTLGMRGQKWLLAYPCFLLYAVFALMAIF